MKILSVDDSRALRQMIKSAIDILGFDFCEASDGKQGLEVLKREGDVDLVLLDWNLPDMDGIKLMRVWKAEENTATLPIIMLSARATEEDRVFALRAGADDYVSKPFSRSELLARIEAVLRRAAASRSTPEPVETRSCNGLEIDIRSLRVMADHKPVHLGPIEFKLLNLFLANPERAFTRPQIVTRIWRSNTYVEDRTVDVHVRRLRRALQDTGHDRYIQTVRGVGYRFSNIESGANKP
jgi:two-component system phosphate regulon response regulator PhoB